MPNPKLPNTIVAEVTKSWSSYQAVKPSELVSGQFELAIQHNDKRGYRLKDWRYGIISYPGEGGEPIVTETIIAVFVRRGSFADAETNEQ